MTIYDSRADRFGRYYDEFVLGDVYRHWPRHTVTEAQDHMFCLLTRAVSPLHVDSQYAEEEMSDGRNLVVGTFIYSLLLGMSVPDTSGTAIAALGTDRLRHLAPVYHGDTVRAESVVIEQRPSKSRADAGIVTIETRGYNQNDELVCDFRRAFLAPMREV